MSVQTTLDGKKVTLWYCIHCPYVGYECKQEGEFEICPKCGWVVYSDEEVKTKFVDVNSNVYPQLIRKYRKIHRGSNPLTSHRNKQNHKAIY